MIPLATFKRVNYSLYDKVAYSKNKPGFHSYQALSVNSKTSKKSATCFATTFGVKALTEPSVSHSQSNESTRVISLW